MKTETSTAPYLAQCAPTGSGYYWVTVGDGVTKEIAEYHSAQKQWYFIASSLAMSHQTFVANGFRVVSARIDVHDTPEGDVALEPTYFPKAPTADCPIVPVA